MALVTACWLAIGVPTQARSASVPRLALDQAYGHRGATLIVFPTERSFFRGNASALSTYFEPYSGDDPVLTPAPGGRVVLAGPLVHGAFTVRRLTAAGTLDARFGRGGLATIAGRVQTLDAVAVDGRGRTLLLGQTNAGAAQSSTGLTLARLLANGAPDPSFGSDGVARLPLTLAVASRLEMTALAVAPDGSLALGNPMSSPSSFPIQLARLQANGTADTRFGLDGSTTIASALLADAPYGVYGIGVAPDGSTLVALLARSGIEVMRLTAAGAPDPAFGSGGVATIPGQSFAAVNALQSLTVNPMALRDGGVLLSESEELADNDDTKETMLVRLTAAGKIDRTFGTNGVLRDRALADAQVLELPSGKLLLAGSQAAIGPTAIRVELRDSDGAPDRRFAGSGSEGLNFTFGGFAVGGSAGAPPSAYSVSKLGAAPDGEVLLTGDVEMDSVCGSGDDSCANALFTARARVPGGS